MTECVAPVSIKKSHSTPSTLPFSRSSWRDAAFRFITRGRSRTVACNPFETTGFRFPPSSGTLRRIVVPTGIILPLVSMSSPSPLRCLRSSEHSHAFSYALFPALPPQTLLPLVGTRLSPRTLPSDPLLRGIFSPMYWSIVFASASRVASHLIRRTSRNRIHVFGCTTLLLPGISLCVPSPPIFAASACEFLYLAWNLEPSSSFESPFAPLGRLLLVSRLLRLILPVTFRYVHRGSYSGGRAQIFPRFSHRFSIGL